MSSVPNYLEKVALKWFNSLPPRSISRFSELSSLFLAYFPTRKFKPKLVSSLLGISQRQEKSLRDFLEQYNAETLLVEEGQTQPAVLIAKRVTTWTFQELVIQEACPNPRGNPDESREMHFPEETEKGTANPGRNQANKKVANQDECPRKETCLRVSKSTSIPP